MQVRRHRPRSTRRDSHTGKDRARPESKCRQSSFGSAGKDSELKLAASPGFAPGPPVSETGALLIMQRGNGRPERFCPSDFLGVGQTWCYLASQALPIGCPVKTFANAKGNHHRAEIGWKIIARAGR